jgi:hypothetical protein
VIAERTGNAAHVARRAQARPRPVLKIRLGIRKRRPAIELALCRGHDRFTRALLVLQLKNSVAILHVLFPVVGRILALIGYHI